MYNPNEDKRENDNNMEPIHGHGENEREEKVFSENESHVQESRESEQNVTAEDAKAEEVKNEHPQQTYHSETLRDYTPEDAQPMCFEPKRQKDRQRRKCCIRNRQRRKNRRNLFM